MWNLADKRIDSRLFIGTAMYPSPQIMNDAIRASQADVVTVSLRRQAPDGGAQNVFWESIRELGLHILPNTAGCHAVKEAVTTAMMARELFDTNWIKLEVIGDEYSLQPDPFALVELAEEVAE